VNFLPALAQIGGNQAAAAAVADLTLWQLIGSVGWVLVPLGLLSFAVVGVIAFNFFWLRPGNLASASFLEEAGALLKARKLEALTDLCAQHHQAVPRALGQVLAFARENPQATLEELKEIAEVEGNRAVARLNLPITLLMDLGVMAPMVGLLGTVIGILRSFGTLAADATPMRTMVLAGGVSQALVATAIGLGVGLLAMAFYAVFRARVQLLIGTLESRLTTLVIRTNAILAQGRPS
jgi:biopolymer transport protein ExbB